MLNHIWFYLVGGEKTPATGRAAWLPSLFYGVRPRSNIKYTLMDSPYLFLCPEREAPINLYQLKAAKSFQFVLDEKTVKINKGEMGGFVENEENLSHDGTCWVLGNARVFGAARVREHAVISGDAVVAGVACVSGYAQVTGEAMVFGRSFLSGTTCVHKDDVVDGKVLTGSA